MPLAPPTIEDHHTSPLSRFITFAANDCRYNDSFSEICVTAIYPIFLKAISKVSKEHNPNWHEAINGPFAVEYWDKAEKNQSSRRNGCLG